ncbi:PilZ domain-containing protein [Chitinivorax sp. B]|uniref:PilZ domain-containing protein n=1 Tax=Chitinivorax sp. B TaxID=2502235 RepID=UPI0010FA2E13|nr:PilZ domain-containing protein [Chitinivorax sp. B]
MNDTLPPASVGLDIILSMKAEPLPDGWIALVDGWMQANQALLAGLAAMEAGGSEQEHEFDAARQPDRIEAKLNLALHLLAQLMASQCQQTRPQAVTLHADMLIWHVDTPLATNNNVLLSLLINSRIPEPLRLPAKIIGCEQISSNSWRISAHFEHVTQSVTDWLERTIFRYHRRQIQARFHPSAAARQ